MHLPTVFPGKLELNVKLPGENFELNVYEHG